MALNIEDAPSNEEILASKRDARARVRLWKKRSAYSVIALLLSCAVVAPFSKGEPLQAYVEPFARILVYVSMALLLVAVYCVALWWGAWSLLRDLEKTYPFPNE